MLSDNLANNEAHVYFARLSELPVSADKWLPLLDDTERDRAARFVLPALTERYILTHGLLRLILGAYLKIAPKAVCYAFNQHNKPMLANAHASTLQFNLSHSDDAVVIAITNGIAVGVDIEKMQTDAKLAVAERFFNPAEVAALIALTPTEQAIMFYRLWAKKEAVVKADGQGFAVLHTAFSVCVTDTPETIALQQTEWSLYTLKLLPDYAAALATSQPVNIQAKSCADILFHSQ